MRKTLAEIAKMIDGEVVGDKDLVITGLSGIQEAREGELTFLANSKYIPLAKSTKAAAIIISRDIDVSDKPVIRTNNPSLAFSELISAMTEHEAHSFQGVHPSAYVGEQVKIGKNVAIGPLAIIEQNVSIGNNTVIYGGAYIGHHALIGDDCIIYPQVTLREHVTIGDRVIIHSGAVIGSDGFGYIQVDGVHKKIPQVGTVVIGHDVEIGANVAIDRARFDKTVIGNGCKIDNLVQVAHNVVMGEHCIIVAQVGISGSANIGKGAILAGQAGITGHISIGEGTLIYAQSAVAKSVPAHSQYSGYPARPHALWKKAQVHTMRLPQYVKMIHDLQKKIKELETKINESENT